MSEVSIVTFLNLTAWPTQYALIRIYYLDGAGNIISNQDVGVNSFMEDEQNVYINTQPFTPNIPENADRIKITLLLRAYGGRWYEVFNLGEFDVNVLKQEEPPFMLRITISSIATQQ